MIRDLGTIRPGTTLNIPFHTFDSNDPSASVTLTGLAVTDIEVYKDGSVTQRASDAGYSLLDTDGIDFDGVTGIHGISIDLSDNTTANFWEAGSQYWVVISSVTVDAATINFVLCTFTIGYPDAILNTTIATLASQTSFTLEEGPADNDALIGCPVLVHDLASAVQMCVGYVSDYVGATRTVTLQADPGIFTMAAGDNASFFIPQNARALGGVLQTGNDVGQDVNDILVDTAEIGVAGAGLTEAGGTGDQLTAVPYNAAWDADIQSECNDALVAFFTSSAALVDAVWDEAQADHVAAGSMGLIASETAQIITDIAALNDLSAAAVNAEVVDVLKTDTIAELSGVPSATPTFEDALMWLYMMARNARTTTASVDTVTNDAGTGIATSAVSDDGTTFTRAEYA